MSGAEGPLRIAVAGGSIGGLCAGVALRRVGFDVQVYERIAGPMETRGAGIVVQGELVDLLRTHGAAALPTTHCRVRRYLSPEGGDGEVQRAPQDFTSWEAIYRTLAAAFPPRLLPSPRRAHGFRQRRRRGAGARRWSRGNRGGRARRRRRCAVAYAPALPAGPELDLRRLRRLAWHPRRGRRSARSRALFRRPIHLLRGSFGRAHPGLLHPR